MAAMSLLSSPSFAEAERKDLYGDLTAEEYLSGRFDPYKNSLFVSLSDLGIPTAGRRIFLRRDAALALALLYTHLKKEHPSVPFWIQSGTRTFFDQKTIWENKWNGRTPVEGGRLNRTVSDPLRRARKILEFSSMPGTSRHHWGTDFDINVLTNAYYKSGSGEILYVWLAANASRYGFCQPYTEGRAAGYLEERWHWSYRPISSLLLADWIRQFEMSGPPGGFDGSVYAKDLARIYAESVSSECK